MVGTLESNSTEQLTSEQLLNSPSLVDPVEQEHDNSPTKEAISESGMTSRMTGLTPKAVQSSKLKGFDFWRTTLRGAKYVVAPMAWRRLTRNYGAELCYTPMFHARMFSDPGNPTYRKDVWAVGPEDRPLIVQFCANDPDHLLAAAKIVEKDCDAVDINLGCPQHIARRGHYGSFLQDEWDLIEKMVRTLDENLSIPVTCKIRIFPEVTKTIEYAKMLERAGCQLLTVHGRLREQKGHNTGMADWEQIRQVKLALNIPVFANGNILYFEDVQQCMDQTGVDGVMSAEATLYNPALFSGKILPIRQLAEEYLALCKAHPSHNKVLYVRGHMFKLYKPCLSIHTDLREQLGKSKTMEDFEQVIKDLNARLEAAEKECNGKFEVTTDAQGIRNYPHWISQPYVRPPNVVNLRKKDRSDTPATPKRKPEDEPNEATIATPDLTAKARRISDRLICKTCPNVASGKCPHTSCKSCCHTNYPKLQDDRDSTQAGTSCEIHYQQKQQPNPPTETNTPHIE